MAAFVDRIKCELLTRCSLNLHKQYINYSKVFAKTENKCYETKFYNEQILLLNFERVDITKNVL